VIGSKKIQEMKNFWQQWPDQIFSFTSNFFFLDNFFTARPPINGATEVTQHHLHGCGHPNFLVVLCALTLGM
jgi:hypothetical protein